MIDEKSNNAPAPRSVDQQARSSAINDWLANTGIGQGLHSDELKGSSPYRAWLSGWDAAILAADEKAWSMRDLWDAGASPNKARAAEEIGFAIRELMKNEQPRILPYDVARCEGVGSHDDDGWDWREGCETCLRRTAPRGERDSFITPPLIIAFECEFLIDP